eukprot:767203-Hanusia_phi.AAC.1
MERSGQERRGFVASVELHDEIFYVTVNVLTEIHVRDFDFFLTISQGQLKLGNLLPNQGNAR